MGETNSRSRVRAFAALPDWSGIWESTTRAQHNLLSGRHPKGEAGLRSMLQLVGHPPYNAEWEARYQQALQNAPPSARTASARKTCSRAFPAIMESPFIFQLVVLPEETLMVFETQQIRHIYTDGRPHPRDEDIWPTRLGDSTGRWEGETLVVDTIALMREPIDPRAPFATLSERAHFTERLRRLDSDRLDDELVIEDPVALAHPWRVTLHFHRVTGLDRLIVYDCAENDRNPVIDGKISIAPTP